MVVQPLVEPRSRAGGRYARPIDAGLLVACAGICRLHANCMWSGPSVGFAVPIYLRSRTLSWRLPSHLPAAPAASWLFRARTREKVLVSSVGASQASGMRCAHAPADGPGGSMFLGQAVRAAVAAVGWKAKPPRSSGFTCNMPEIIPGMAARTAFWPKRVPGWLLGGRQACRVRSASVSRATAGEWVRGQALPDDTNQERRR